MIADRTFLYPFIPFSKDFDGGFNSALFCSNDDKGDIIIDCCFREYRPKYIDIQIDWDDKWKGFKTRDMNIGSPEKMKTLFSVDCSRSITGMKIYFKKLRELI